MIDFFRQELEFQRAALGGEGEPSKLCKDCLLHLLGAALLTGFQDAERRINELLERGFEDVATLSEELTKLPTPSPLSMSVEPGRPLAPREVAPEATIHTIGDGVGLESFLAEAERLRSILLRGLLALSEGRGSPELLEEMMRAAHSLKGASAIVGLEALVPLAHHLEDRLVAQQQGQPVGSIDAMFEAVEFFEHLENLDSVEQASGFLKEHSAEISSIMDALKSEPTGEFRKVVNLEPQAAVGPTTEKSVLRLDASFLDDLMGMAGRLKVSTYSLSVLLDRLRVLKGLEVQISEQLSRWQDASPELGYCFEGFQRLIDELSQRVYELDAFEIGLYRLSRGLTEQVVRARMRPFSELSGKLRRRVRKLERDLQKPVDIEVLGENTPVDRDILQRLEPALGHIITNSIDHGIESPEDRKAMGKGERGRVRLQARHSGGSFELVVEDDGRGVDPEALRGRLVERGLVSPEAAADLSEAELGDFLLRPRFSTKTEVSEHSGRGVGLDIVREVVVASGGHLVLKLRPGKGLRFEITLPVTLSTTRALVFDIQEQLFALPLTQIAQVIRVGSEQLSETPEGLVARHGRLKIYLSRGDQVLGLAERPLSGGEFQVAVLKAGHRHFGLIVDRFLGRQDLILQKLPPLLGRVRDVSAAAQLDDGSIVFLLEPEELLFDMERCMRCERESILEVRVSA